MAKVTVLYDSLCPVCRREVQFLLFAGRRDGLRLVDIADPAFQPQEFGLTLEQCIGSLRGFDQNGKAIEGMATIRAMYDAVGLGWMMRWSSLPIVSGICDAGYRVFARMRPRFSAFDPSHCATDRCEVPKKS